MPTTNSTPALPWTLRFTEWHCGHHGQRPEDIPVASPEQAKAILWAIACAISQPGHARAVLFDATRGFDDIYITDDHCDFDPARSQKYRPEVVLCADEAMAAAILAPELRGVRLETVDPDLYRCRLWDGKDLPEAEVDVGEGVLTLLTREEVEKLADVDDTSLTPRVPLFALPPVYFDGSTVLAKLRAEAEDLRAYEEQQAQEHQAEVDRDEAADLKRDAERLDPTTDNHEPDTEP